MPEVGRNLPRKDGVAKISGKEPYSHDIHLPNMLYAAVYRSPLAHVRIRYVDTSGAQALGAICLTPQEVPDVIYNERIVSIPTKTYKDRRVLPTVALVETPWDWLWLEPTELDTPWPRGPVVTSTPGSSADSG
jgi:CO/xanthine dehydrogenase Mo-binding subunit